MQSTKTVDEPTCQKCGAKLASVTIDVDQWNAFVCTEHANELRAQAPPSCVVYPIEKAEGE